MADPLGGIAELASHTPFKGGANINPLSSAGTGMCGDVSGTASESGMSGYNTRYDYRWRVVRVCVLLMLCIVYVGVVCCGCLNPFLYIFITSLHGNTFTTLCP